MTVIAYALLYGLMIAVVLRAPYWFYKRRKGEPRPFWWPWGIALTLLASATVFYFFYRSIMATT